MSFNEEKHQDSFIIHRMTVPKGVKLTINDIGLSEQERTEYAKWWEDTLEDPMDMVYPYIEYKQDE